MTYSCKHLVTKSASSALITSEGILGPQVQFAIFIINAMGSFIPNSLHAGFPLANSISVQPIAHTSLA
jgi:hypothetical protein